MRLTIAEKLHDATEIARLLGARARGKGYFYNDREIVTWANGHIVELAEPVEYDERFRAWKRETLPILPEEFKYRILPRAREQFTVISGLMAREDVELVINACDASREGELVFDLIAQEARNQKPVKRLWLRAKTDEDIRAAYSFLRPASATLSLLRAARARQRADWLIGINITRALTLKAKTRKTYSVGRVITPLVALVVARDDAIENFKPAPYFELEAKFSTSEGLAYSGCYFLMPCTHGSKEKRVHRFEKRSDADRVARELSISANILSVMETEVEMKQPLLYDLTALQIEANIRYGLSAEETLAAAQELWDKGLITFPRSSSQHLPSTINAQLELHLSPLSRIADSKGTHLAHAAQHIRRERLRLTRRHVDDHKLKEGHHAIIPSKSDVDLKEIPQPALSVYDLIARRFLAAFYPHERVARTEIITACFEHHFLTRGVRELSPGWRIVDPPSARENLKSETDSDGMLMHLPKLLRGESVRKRSYQTLTKRTRAPQRYTEASLLLAIASAGESWETEEERQAIKRSGLGTPATRAATIEKAFKLGYLEREEKRFIRSTAHARDMVNHLRFVNPNLLSAALTGRWEAELVAIAEGKNDRQFNESVQRLTIETVEQIFASRDEARALCPQCKAAGRTGVLHNRVGSTGKFLSCSLSRQKCGYVSDHTDHPKELFALQELRCAKCKSAMRLRHAKESTLPYLACTRRGCRGVRFFSHTRLKTETVGDQSALQPLA